MKRATFVVILLVLLLVHVEPYGLAQEPGERIDDLTPLPAQPAGKADDSDEQHVPQTYEVATGGPDLYGYTYEDSRAGTCDYRWIEPAGIEATLAGDDGTISVPIGFAFPFYGRSYTQLGLDSNGVLLLGDAASDWVNVPLGPDGPSPRVAPFWDDLQLESVFYQVVGRAPERMMVVTFHARQAEGAALRFQALLGEDGKVVFQYQSLLGAGSDGSGATVGIQGSHAGLGYLFNGYPRENRLHEGLAVCFAPPDGVYLSPGLQRGHAVAGQQVEYVLAAINRTGADGSFAFAVESPWPATVSPQQAELGEGAVLELVVRVDVPEGVPGERIEAVVTMAGAGAAATRARLGTVRASGAYGYTGASTTDDAAVFDLQTWARLTGLSLLPEGDYPYDATMKPDGSEVWIPGAAGDGVVVIDTATNTVVQRIAVGEYPVSVAFGKDSAYACVANRDSETVSVVDTASYAVVQTVPIPTTYLGAGNAALDPTSGLIYLVDWYGDYLYVLDPQTWTVTDELLLGNNLWQLVASPLGGRLYVTDRGTDMVRVVDTATLTEIATIPVGDDPWGIDITRDGSLIYVTNEDSHNLTVIDATNNSVITTLGLPNADATPRDVDFDRAGAYAYVPSGSIAGDDLVYVLELATHTVVGQVNVIPSANPNVVAVAPQMAAAVELFAIKSAFPEPVVLGDPLTYTISFDYTGLVPATQVLVTDTLPAGTIYLTSSGGLTSTYDAVGHRIIWELGDVEPATQDQLLARILPVEEALAGQTVVNEAYLDFTSFANFSATVQATSTVVAPALSILVDGVQPDDPLLLCEGESVTLEAETNRAEPLVYAWDLGDGTLSGEPQVSHGWVYGDYLVVLTTTNAYGWVETDTLSVEAGHDPLAGFVSNSPVTLGQNAVFTSQVAYEPATWAWDFGDGVGTSTDPNPVYNYSNPDTYTVTLTVTNRCGTDAYAEPFIVEPSGRHYVYLPLVWVNRP